jgi:octaprenyl-diphosphate synthase
MALPIIYMLGEKDLFEKRKIIYYFKHHHNDPENIRQIIKLVNRSGGIEYAHSKMLEYRDKAFQILYDWPDCEIRRSLEMLITFSIERKN